MPAVSERTRNLGTEHAFVVLDEVNRLAAQGRSIISFAIGQPDFVTPASIRDAARRAMDAGHTGYTPSAGIPELRRAAAEYLSRTRGVPFAPEHVVAAGGAKPFIQYALLCVTDYGAGHEVLYPEPGFPIYASQIAACGAVPVPLPLPERHAFGLDPEALAGRLSSRSRLLILNSPHNPTGRTLTRQELARIAEIVRPWPELWILSDEVYSQMVHDAPFASIAAEPEVQARTIVVDGVSKSYAMTGWRLGFAANEALAPHLATWVTNTDSCASSISQWAAVEALTGPQEEHRRMMESFTRRRGRMVAGLNELPGVHALRPGGAFYVWPNVTDLCGMVGAADAEELRRRWLHEAGVAVLADRQFGPPPPGEGHHMRFSYAASDEDIDAGLQRLADWIRKARR